jgi:hypothetical protein
MDEAEWLACVGPEPLLLFLAEAGASDRKRRLFGCACVRGVWGELADERLRQATEVAERFADGLATARQLESARKKAARLHKGVGDIIADHGAMAVTALCERTAGWFVPAESMGAVAAEARFDERTSWGAAHEEEKRAQAVALRDVFGNPFRPVTVPGAWLTPAVVALAEAAYEERLLPSGELDTQRLAILADALEEAGAAGALLEHLRSSGPHVRGCFAVDLVLARE